MAVGAVRPGQPPGGPAAPGLPPRRRVGAPAERSAAVVARLADQPEPGGRRRGAGDRAGAGRPLARAGCSPATGRRRSGPCSPRSTRSASDQPGLLARLVDLAPATLPLGLFAAVRTIRLALIDEDDDPRDRRRRLLGALAGRGGAGPGGLAERPAAAARAVPAGPAEPAGGLGDRRPGQPPDPGPDADLARPGDGRLRRLVAQRATSAARWPTWSTAGSTRRRRWASTWRSTCSIVVVLLTRGLDRWARRRDDRQRRVLGGFLAAVVRRRPSPPGSARSGSATARPTTC